MPVLEFTIDPTTGELQMHIQGIAGPTQLTDNEADPFGAHTRSSAPLRTRRSLCRFPGASAQRSRTGREGPGRTAKDNHGTQSAIEPRL